jgi:hypothetical protein
MAIDHDWRNRRAALTQFEPGKRNRRAPRRFARRTASQRHRTSYSFASTDKATRVSPDYTYTYTYSSTSSSTSTYTSTSSTSAAT